jgi:hypothetical protein
MKMAALALIMAALLRDSSRSDDWENCVPGGLA